MTTTDVMEGMVGAAILIFLALADIAFCLRKILTELRRLNEREDDKNDAAH